MSDDIDAAVDRVELETELAIQKHARRPREEPSEYCIECGDHMPERFKLGYATCIHCQTAIERHQAQHPGARFM